MHYDADYTGTELEVDAGNKTLADRIREQLEADADEEAHQNAEPMGSVPEDFDVDEITQGTQDAMYAEQARSKYGEIRGLLSCCVLLWVSR